MFLENTDIQVGLRESNDGVRDGLVLVWSLESNDVSSWLAHMRRYRYDPGG
ncbi:hypothetical protein [Haloplanus pelagicus]|jgi:hypothetical protein|uniref:hypothetical protein n=1 Tax=Haloplanus pelagicus TaxID=2949995 RepID=UPI00203DDA6F|nr:hypothetical protein [Haloplanus sp. HW8-1]